MSVRSAAAHFEVLLFFSMWLDAAVLAALAGRPALGAIGFLTVLPILVAYVLKARRG
mgnify:FL=1